MGLEPTYERVLLAGLVFAAVTAVASAFVRTPYGRFASAKWGPSLPIRAGWLCMEAPAVVFYPVFFGGPRALQAVPLFFAALWTLHYGNRAVVFPLRMRPRPDGRMALVVVLMGMGTVAVHAWLYARWLSVLGRNLDASWWTDPRFLIGTSLYLVGFALNVQSDGILRRLRDPTRSDAYVIPRGGVFRWVSCPHYLGELAAWSGLALATRCPGGLFILAVTAANLVPRALATHRWYRERFADYPPERRALLPFLL